jgi:acyl-CoA dehydrogenase
MIDLLVQTLDKILARSEHDPPSSLDDPRASTWEQLREHGLLTPFQHGVERWSDAAELIGRASGRAPGLPLSEQLVSSYLSRELGAPDMGDLTTLADPNQSDLVVSNAGVSGRAAMVPHVAVATHVWAEAHTESRTRELLLFEVRGVEAHSGENIAGEPRDTLTLMRAPTAFRHVLNLSFSPLLWLGALARAVQMASLAEAVLASSLEHARTRMQFGRAIGSFQAVQQELAVLACEVAALSSAIDAASRGLDEVGVLGIAEVAEPIAAAKIQAGITTRRAVEVGHAVHAAIGFTREHPLHRYTQRLLSYRAEFGAEAFFARFLGARARRAGAENLWHQLVSASRPAPLHSPAESLSSARGSGPPLPEENP